MKEWGAATLFLLSVHGSAGAVKPPYSTLESRANMELKPILAKLDAKRYDIDTRLGLAESGQSRDCKNGWTASLYVTREPDGRLRQLQLRRSRLGQVEASTVRGYYDTHGALFYARIFTRSENYSASEVRAYLADKTPFFTQSSGSESRVPRNILAGLNAPTALIAQGVPCGAGKLW